jgi:protoporphyrinogen oxidase
MGKINVVVGGGIAGLFASLILAERDKKRVVLVEREDEVGGLLRCFDYGAYGRFDYGMHNMYETGIAELDSLLLGLLPVGEWQFLEGVERDLAGLYFSGSLQVNSPFPDLRKLPVADWDACLVGLFRQLDEPSVSSQNNAYDYVASNFGVPIAEVVDKALLKQFGKPARELTKFSTQLTTLSRVVMFGEECFSDLILSSQLRQRIAYPEQRSLPPEWHSGRKAYYPAKYGIYRVIDALVERLARAGVQILTGAQVKSLVVEADVVSSVSIESNREVQTLRNVDKLIWTSGVPSIAAMLGVDLKSYTFDPPRRTVVVNILLKTAPVMGDLYYFYCYEPGFKTFRVTNFTAYCAGAPRNGLFPIAVELLLDSPLPEKDEMISIAVSELLKFGVIATSDCVEFCAPEVLVSGFPMPSTRNFDALCDMRDRIAGFKLNNLVLLGVMSEDNIFFQRDVLAQTYEKLTERVSNHG